MSNKSSSFQYCDFFFFFLPYLTKEPFPDFQTCQTAPCHSLVVFFLSDENWVVLIAQLVKDF